MKNTVFPTNPYKIGFTLWQKQQSHIDRQTLIRDYTETSGKISSAKDLRSLHLDYGRRSGKGKFANYMLERYRGSCIIITGLKGIQDFMWDDFQETANLKKARHVQHEITHVGFAIYCIDNFKEITLGYNIHYPDQIPISKHGVHSAILLKNADYVIIDEPGFFSKKDLDTIYNFCKNDATFIKLGRARK